MSKYVVDLARYWKYTVEAKNKSEAEELAYILFQQDEGKYARYDDIMVTNLGSSTDTSLEEEDE